MAHAHDHHSPGHGVRNYNRTFAIAIGLNVAFVVVEVIYGLLAGSLALLADAGHNLSDVLGLLLAWGASYLASRQASRWRTYGLRKTTILAALFNALILLVAIGAIAWEAISRLNTPAEVAGITVIVVAGIGVVINAATMMLFMADRKSDLNIRGAFVHMAADAGISLGVVITGIVILYSGVQWLDPLISLLIAAVIFVGTWALLRDSLNLALDAVPKGIEPKEIEAFLVSLEGVEAVHDLHIWGISTTEVALTAHLVKPDPSDDDKVIAEISRVLKDRYRIDHATIQWERDTRVCPSGVEC
ncbi:cation diffusion facilitator family transporter [Marinobacter salicampi]|uniref:cation diffusion facilitator family transporter n=1 Tax=Marinobacter salicampi TaxID=435907 RepID=UPI00140B13A6|nr:cation diffusion facilitator family transporter [Marinobacter salicampi]